MSIVSVPLSYGLTGGPTARTLTDLITPLPPSLRFRERGATRRQPGRWYLIRRPTDSLALPFTFRVLEGDMLNLAFAVLGIEQIQWK